MKRKNTTPAASPAPQYAQLLGEIKQRIRQAKARAWMAVNAEMIRLYWRIGQVIDSRQQQEGYGTAVFPGWPATCTTSCRRKRASRSATSSACWPSTASTRRRHWMPHLVSQPVAQGAAAAEGTADLMLAAAHCSAALLMAVPWGHHAVLMEKVKDAAAHQWSMHASVENDWSRYLLQDHNQAASHQRAGKAARNFSLRLRLAYHLQPQVIVRRQLRLIKQPVRASLDQRA